MAVNPSHLPTRSEFLQDGVVVVDQCDICHELFEGEHKPARIRGQNCRHIFGQPCLFHWFDSNQANSDRCPVCREILFAKPRIPHFVRAPRRDANSDRWLHKLRDRSEAENFVKEMWDRLFQLLSKAKIYETDIEEHIHGALQATAIKFEHKQGLHIIVDHWPAVKLVAENMTRVHHENGVYRFCDAALQTRWMPEMLDALGWYDLKDQGNEAVAVENEAEDRFQDATEDEAGDDDAAWTTEISVIPASPG